MAVMRRELRLESGGVLCYELTRKRVKRVNVRVRADGSVAVSASPAVPLAVIEGFLRSKEAFLMAAIKKAAARREAEQQRENGGCARHFGQPLALSFVKGGTYRAERTGENLCLTLRAPESETARRAALERWEKETCAAEAERLLQKWLPTLAPYGVPRPTLRFRAMRSRWGSCVPQKGTVTLNTRLLDKSAACFEGVLLHELCHFLQPDHSAAFYGWMDCFLPDWRQRRALLRQGADEEEK